VGKVQKQDERFVDRAIGRPIVEAAEVDLSKDSVTGLSRTKSDVLEYVGVQYSRTRCCTELTRKVHDFGGRVWCGRGDRRWKFANEVQSGTKKSPHSPIFGPAKSAQMSPQMKELR
jgi:hypothetical protein